MSEVASKRTSAWAAASHSFTSFAAIWLAHDSDSLPAFAGGGARATYFVDVRRLGIGDPSQASRGDSGDAVGDAVVVAELFGTVGEEADESPVDVAEAEEAEVIGVDGTSHRG